MTPTPHSMATRGICPTTRTPTLRAFSPCAAKCRIYCAKSWNEAWRYPYKRTRPACVKGGSRCAYCFVNGKIASISSMRFGKADSKSVYFQQYQELLLSQLPIFDMASSIRFAILGSLPSTQYIP